MAYQGLEQVVPVTVNFNPFANIEVGQRIEPAQAENQFTIVRNAPADETGVPALWHDRRRGGGTGGQHGGHFLSAGGAYHGERSATEAAGPIDLVPRHQIRVGEDVFAAHDCAEVR